MNSNTRNILLIISIAMTTTLYFIFFEFIGIDDVSHIVRNPNMHSLDGLLNIWRAPYFGLYIPISYSGWWGIYQIAGASPWIFHLANVLLHALNGILVYFLARCIFEDIKLSFWASVLFILHPFQAGSVAWVSEFRGLLGASFALVSLLSTARYSRNKQVSYLGLSILFFAASILSKPYYVSVCLISPLLNYWIVRRYDKRVIALFIIEATLSTILVVKTQGLQMVPESQVHPMVIVNNLGFYVLSALAPSFALFDYDASIETMKQFSPYLVPAILGIGLFTWGVYKKRGWALFSAFFAIALLPVLGFTPFAFQSYNTVADRYLYFANVFFVFAFALSLRRVAKSYFLAALFLATIYYSAFFFLNSLPFRNSRTLGEYILSHRSQSFVAFTLLGDYNLKHGDFRESEKNLRAAIDIKPDFWAAHSQLGELFESERRWEESRQHFQSIISNEGSKYKYITATILGEFMLRLGLAQFNLGLKEEGLKNIEMGRTLSPARYQEMLR